MHYVVLLLRNILDMPLTLVSLGVTEKWLYFLPSLLWRESDCKIQENVDL
jgi:hypothetical protein